MIASSVMKRKSPIKVYYVYAPSSRDEALRLELERHLKTFEHSGLIAGWHRGEILAGKVSASERLAHLQQAQLILLLISPDFLSSEETYDIEMKLAMERYERGEAQVIPILLRPVLYKNAPFANLEMLPDNRKAITSWPHPDEAFENVANGLDRVLQYLSQEQIPIRPPGAAYERLKRGPLSWTRNTLLTWLFIAALVILLIGGSGSLVYGNYYLSSQRHISATATSLDLGTITTKSNATATAVIATSDAHAASHPPYPPSGAKLVMNDPLQDTSRGYGWKTDSANCQFPGDGYHIAIEAIPESFECFGSKTDFNNFVFEAQMTILKGDAGGLVFRADANNSKYYKFEINKDGHYDFYEYTTLDNYILGASGQISGFHTGIDQHNLLAVKAQSNAITFYNNYHFITTVTYYDYSEGQIGFEASSNTNPTEVVFSNVKVWKL